MTTRPTAPDIDQGLEQWDATVNSNTGKVFDQPFPIHEHTGDESDLESTFPAAQFGNCVVWVNHSTLGWVLYATDGNGAWGLYSQREKQISKTVTSAATLADQDRLVIFDSSSAATITLMPAANVPGASVTLFQKGTGIMTVDGNASETINGATTFVAAAQYDAITIYCTGTEWIIANKSD